MKRDRGFPFITKFNDEIIDGIILMILEEGVMYYNKDSNGNFVTKFLPQGIDKRTLKFNNAIIKDLELHAKIVAFESSATKYGMRQRKEEFLNTVLPVIEFGISDRGDYVVLLSARADEAVLKMDVDDIIFVFPVMNKSN